MLRRLFAFLALFLVGSLDAPAAARDYPSLARRPIESRDRGEVTASGPVEPAPADPALVAEVATLSQKAAAGDAAFQTKLADGRTAVAQADGADPVSESWVVAQVAISALDSARYDSVAALASLDTLHVERMNAADSARVAADMATVDPTRADVLAMVDRQNDALDALRNTLRKP